MLDAIEKIVLSASEPFEKSAVTTDNSFLLIHSPEKCLDLHDMLRDQCFPELVTRGVPHVSIDLSGFLFNCFNEDEMHDQESDEFRNYRLMRQGLSARVERKLESHIQQIALESPGTNLFLLSTHALFPLVRFGEVLRNLRNLPVRIFVTFPGEERGGKPHFMNEADGGNYLAVKITINN